MLMKGDRAFLEFGAFKKEEGFSNPFSKQNSIGTKLFDFNYSFKGNHHTSLLMSNGFEKAFMYDAGRRELFEFNSNSIIYYHPLEIGFNRNFCDKRACVLKFDTKGNMYYHNPTDQSFKWFKT